MLKKENKMNELQELLDSDDELPTTYNEVPETPAYLNDSRFDAIKFSWLNSGQTRRCPKKKEINQALTNPTPETYKQSNPIESLPKIYHVENTIQSNLEAYQETTTHTIQYLRKTYDKGNQNNDGTFKQTNRRTLMKKGILNEKDILCLKSLAALASDDATILWFTDFLIYKDMQSHFKFPRSCLVGHQLHHEFLTNPMPNKSTGYFELVIV